ncbi:MAG: DUF5989 family protein [Candidatus Omnitrophota bacterium]|nr:DUF5989 family protein [Candidatus Omnitrophota bacterium]
MSKARVLVEVWQLLREQKKYWLIPIVVLMVLFGLVLIAAQSTPMAPFVYTLF